MIKSRLSEASGLKFFVPSIQSKFAKSRLSEASGLKYPGILQERPIRRLASQRRVD